MEQQNTPPSGFQQLIGRSIVRLVMWGTIIISTICILFALFSMNSDPERVKNAFAIIQYILAALLPLWGTWIGTILAYYYSKDNFESANKSVQDIVQKLTSEKKLDSVKAKDVMITKDKLTVQRMNEGEDLSKFKLKADCLDFLKTNTIKRVIILDDKDRAKYVIHRDLISYFIANEMPADKPVEEYTLKDMYDLGSDETKDTFANSAKFIGEQASLLEAKNIIQRYKNCQDVFITKSGSPEEPILGWITNVTINENSIV